MLLGATNDGRGGLPAAMRQRIATLVSPNITKNSQEPTLRENSLKTSGWTRVPCERFA
jgi:hypothetical protein